MAGIDISVIVPAYNAAPTLEQCLTSALESDVASIEVIVIDDGSSDGSGALMDRIAASDGRVRVLHRQNAGYGASVNCGFDEARGAYVAILEADDWVLPHAYDELFELAEIYGAPDVVKSSYRRILQDPAGGAIDWHSYLHGRIHPKRQPFRLASAPQLIEFHPSIWSALYRRSFLETCGIRMMEAPGAGWVDNPFVVETLAQAASIVYTDDEYYCYREDLASASTARATVPLMLRRWLDRQDVLDRLGVRDAGILRANYAVGFKYLDRAMDEWETLDAATRELANRVCWRMDPRIVRSMGGLRPSTVNAYAKACSLPWPPRIGVGHAAWLAGETIWGIANNGPAFVRFNLGKALPERSVTHDISPD